MVLEVGRDTGQSQNPSKLQVISLKSKPLSGASLNLKSVNNLDFDQNPSNLSNRVMSVH